MSKPTVTSVKAELDTHEAVCAERWKETILRIKRIETIMIGTGYDYFVAFRYNY